MSGTKHDAVSRIVREVQGYAASEAALARMSDLQDAIAAARAAVMPASLFDTEPAQLAPTLDRLAESGDV